MKPQNQKTTEELAVRINDANPNHHLWNNNGTWWMHYTVYPTPITVERKRRSLRTHDVSKARNLRDQLLSKVEAA